jgi:hypothetical protein
MISFSVPPEDKINLISSSVKILFAGMVASGWGCLVVVGGRRSAGLRRR